MLTFITIILNTFNAYRIYNSRYVVILACHFTGIPREFRKKSQFPKFHQPIGYVFKYFGSETKLYYMFVYGVQYPYMNCTQTKVPSFITTKYWFILAHGRVNERSEEGLGRIIKTYKNRNFYPIKLIFRSLWKYILKKLFILECRFGEKLTLLLLHSR